MPFTSWKRAELQKWEAHIESVPFKDWILSEAQMLIEGHDFTSGLVIIVPSLNGFLKDCPPTLQGRVLHILVTRG